MLRKSKRQSTRSKQNAKWAVELKQWWIDNDMPQICELCGGTFGIAFAHSKKRRFILDRETYWTVALLCQSCHHDAEYGGHDRMERIILDIIANR